MWFNLYYNGELVVRGLDADEAQVLAQVLLTEFGGLAVICPMPYR